MTQSSDVPLEEESPSYVRIIPLGGLGEVGKNCMAIEFDDEIIVIDCGITFPDAEDLGVDTILPDWTWLLDQAERISGVFLTHGHEDHIGAMPHLLRELDVPVYGLPLTMALLRHKLDEHRLLDECLLFEVAVGDEIELDTVSIEFVHVSHSIPDSAAIAIHTPLGIVLHSGDWRVDHTPVIGKPTDFGRLSELGESGVLCLLADSTNVEQPGVSASESSVREGLRNAIASAQGRVFVTLFSSNVHRIHTLFQIAAQQKRRVVVLGRSLQNMVGHARRTGHLTLPNDNILIDLDTAADWPEDRLMVIMTGSQGEPRSALSRLAFDDYNNIAFHEDDTVIFSARIVPGNEMRVHRLVNELAERGIKAITKRHANVHTTGHAYSEEIRYLLGLIKPHYFVPVHGDHNMMSRHIELALSLGIPEAKRISNGVVLEIDQDGWRTVGHVQTGRTLVSGSNVGSIDENVLRERRKLVWSGAIAVSVVLDEQGDLIAGPTIIQQGTTRDDGRWIEDLQLYVEEGLDKLALRFRTNPTRASEEVRALVRRFFRRRFDRKPIVFAMVEIV